MTSVNIHELAARAAKVGKLLAYVPHGQTREEIASIADTLEAAGSVIRAKFAEVAGVNVPSDETWRQVVESARGRLTHAEMFARLATERGIAEAVFATGAVVPP